MITETNSFVKPLVRRILERAEQHTWTLQGFGMLRTYLPGDLRLSVWDSRFQYKPKPSMIHDHPWDFVSLIVAGELTNIRYHLLHDRMPTHMMRKIKPGEGTFPLSEDQLVSLHIDAMEVTPEACTYGQRWDEIHETAYVDGTVTLVKRDRGTKPDHARVFWPIGELWQTAEPRVATPEEVQEICQNSLKKFF